MERHSLLVLPGNQERKGDPSPSVEEGWLALSKGSAQKSPGQAVPCSPGSQAALVLCGVVVWPPCAPRPSSEDSDADTVQIPPAWAAEEASSPLREAGTRLRWQCPTACLYGNFFVNYWFKLFFNAKGKLFPDSKLNCLTNVEMKVQNT